MSNHYLSLQSLYNRDLFFADENFFLLVFLYLQPALAFFYYMRLEGNITV